MKFKWPKDSPGFDLEKHSILVSLSGSRSYGTEHPLSDTDYRGILIEPSRIFYSPFNSFEQFSWKGDGKTGRLSEIDGLAESDEEGTIYSLNKFSKLCSSSNPNILEALYVSKEHILHITEEGEKLIDNRSLFLSKRALSSFTGYALSQLKRIKTHKKWIDNPPKKPVLRSDFDLPEEKVIKPDQQQAARRYVESKIEFFAPWLLEQDSQHQNAFYEGLGNILANLFDSLNIEYSEDLNNYVKAKEFVNDKISERLGFDSNFMLYLKREKSYAVARQEYRQYKSWLKNRNPARAELESKYKYDTKHAMHLVRLIRMGEEILKTGTFKVYRPDREELKEIRNGSLSYEELIEWSDRKVKELYSFVREGKCTLPDKPDYEKINELIINIREDFYRKI